MISIKNNKGVFLDFSLYGATWLSCLVPLKNELRNILLTPEDPQNNSEAFLGATIGRYSNRIKNAELSYNNDLIQLIPNQNKHQLHGGKKGFFAKKWTLQRLFDNRVVFSLISEDGDQGYPGKLKIVVDYHLTEDNKVIINYIATTNKKTPINLTNHAYFNLDGKGNILNHRLKVKADYYLPVDSEGIPSATLTHVECGKMDLRDSIIIGETIFDSPDRAITKGYDHAYLLKHNSDSLKLIEPIATLTSSDKLIQLNTYTNKPAIQIYTGNFLNNSHNIKNRFEDYSGIALETEFLPDSPNHTDYNQESCWFDENDFYHYTTIYELLY